MAFTNPLLMLSNLWAAKLKKAREHKQRFQDEADESMTYFHGRPESQMMRITRTPNHTGLVISANELELKNPSVIITLNKAAELVQVFGPSLYSQNPNRRVTPRRWPLLPIGSFGNPADPAVQMYFQTVAAQTAQARLVDLGRATLLETMLNYSPQELDLYGNSRMTVDEAILKGMGVWWTKIYQPPGFPQPLVGSFYDSIDNLLMDPDAEKVEDIQWSAQFVVSPHWQVEAMYGMPAGSLKGRGTIESYNAQASNTLIDPAADYRRRSGESNDLIGYYHVYSKMGLGGRLKDADSTLSAALDRYGQFTYLCVVPGVEYPLNLNPWMVQNGDDQAVMKAVQWPAPFWMDGGWPWTGLIFHKIPRQVWPQSHLKPAMAELKFLNWAFSHLASKIRVTCRDFLVIPKEIDPSLQSDIMHGPDLTLLRLSADELQRFGSIIQFLQHPAWNGDIFKMIQAVSDLFDRRTGLTELMYGQSSTQIRSAAESDMRAGQMNIRPGDMRYLVEKAMAELATKEAMVLRTYIRGQNVAQILGPVNAQVWDSIVFTPDPVQGVHQNEYGIEAGSTAKPDKGKDQTNANQMMQTLFTPFFNFGMQTGQFAPVNALLTLYGKAFDIDTEKLLLQPPPMPAMPPAAPPGPGGQPTANQGPPAGQPRAAA